jgi:hypothetical protein
MYKNYILLQQMAAIFFYKKVMLQKCLRDNSLPLIDLKQK